MAKDVRSTASLGITLAKSTVVRTCVSSFTAVVGFVQSIEDAKEMTGCAFDPAELCIHFHLFNHAVKYLAQISDDSMLCLEPLHIVI